MEYIYTAMLLHSAGKEITEENVEKILKAAGVKPDPTRVKALTASLEGVDIEEAMSTAFSVPAVAAPQVAEPVEEKKEEEKKKKKEVSEEEAAAGLGALFG
ncbi:MAG: 50S ribosomal protein P1 [Thermoplasmata archaeon]